MILRKQLGLTTAQDKVDYVTYYEKSAQLTSPTQPFICFLILITLLAILYFLLRKQDLLNSLHYTLQADFIKSTFLLL